jgi:hypothetical protein
MKRVGVSVVGLTRSVAGDTSTCRVVVATDRASLTFG